MGRGGVGVGIGVGLELVSCVVSQTFFEISHLIILVQQNRTAHLQREYVQFIGAGSVATFAGGPWGYGCT